MPVNIHAYEQIISKVGPSVTLVAVSKTKPASDIEELYGIGHRDFGENYVQELLEKQVVLPDDIRWHFIGHLQSNKVKYIIPFVHLIHGIDSLKLILEVQRQAARQQRVVDCLLQVHIALEETKFGFNEQELDEVMNDLRKYQAVGELDHVRIRGLMGMATLTGDESQVRKEFAWLRMLFDKHAQMPVHQDVFNILSMGMSQDYELAVELGSTMIRIGSALFGERRPTPRVNE